MTNLRDESLEWLIRIIAAAGGRIDSSDSPNNLLNAFCDDRGSSDDTFNVAHELGLLQTSHDTSFDTSTTWLTDAGRDYFSGLRQPARDTVPADRASDMQPGDASDAEMGRACRKFNIGTPEKLAEIMLDRAALHQACDGERERVYRLVREAVDRVAEAKTNDFADFNRVSAATVATDRILAARHQPAPATDGEDLKALLRNVVSHATGGTVTDCEGMSLNEISCRITETRNHAYNAGKEYALRQLANKVEEK